MTESVRLFDGDDWERRCLMLLSLRYQPAELIRVPSDRTRDLGLDAVTRDGCLYQCYSTVEPRSVDARYGAQRDKLTEDVGKLKTNASEVEQLVGGCVISRYLFMVPRYDGARIQIHANHQAKRVRAMGLAFVSDEFEITVVTDEAYVAERAQLARLGALYADVPMPVIADPDVEQFAHKQATLVENLDRKLAKLDRFQLPVRRQPFTRRLLQHYLASEEMLEALRRDYPEIWAAVSRATTGRERSLPAESMAAEAPPLRQLNSVRIEHEAVLAGIEGIAPDTASELAWGTTAGWLMRCPLDFPVSEVSAS